MGMNVKTEGWQSSRMHVRAGTIASRLALSRGRRGCTCPLQYESRRLVSIVQSGDTLASVEIDLAYDGSGNLSTVTRTQDGQVAVVGTYGYDSGTRKGVGDAQRGRKSFSVADSTSDPFTGTQSSGRLHGSSRSRKRSATAIISGTQ
jgi:YD repeat-containing protein